MDLSNFWWSGAGGGPGPGPGPDPGDPIGQSLRFRGAQSLSGHSGGSGTASVWIKRGKLTAAQTVMAGIAFAANDKLNASVGLLRDPSAWLHVVVNADGTYVNSERVANGSAIAANTIGTSCDLYLAGFHFVDGQKLDPTTFGRFNSEGVWVPVDPKKDGDTAWYGANGFHLTFADPADVGKDYSGNGNDFTATGFETTDQASPNYDIVKDSPTNNFATINPLFKNGSTKDANLTAAGHTPCWPRPQTIAFPAEGPHMFEWQTGANTGYDLVMISADPNTVNKFGGNSIYIQAGQNTSSPNLNGSYSQVTITGAGTVFQPNKYYQVSWDGASMRLYQEGALITTYTNFPDIPQFLGIGNNYDDQYLEYGQRGFKHPIAGFKSLSTANMPAATIANGRDHFQAITGPGQGSVTSTVTDIQTLNQLETHFTADATLTPQSNADLIGVRVFMSGGSGAGGSASFTESLGGAPAVYGSNGGDTEWRTRLLSKADLNGSGAFTSGAGGTINSSGAGSYGGGAGQLSQFVTNGGGITLTAAGSDGGAGRYRPPGTTVYTSAGGKADAGNMSVVSAAYAAIAGGKGAASRSTPGQTNGSPGNTGQMYSLELYPTSSGIGALSPVVVLTFDAATGLSDIAAGDAVENLTGTATGTVVFIDGSTMYVEQTSGQFSIGDQLLTLSGPGSGLLGLAQLTFPSGLWWIKDRTRANQHQLVDSVRGGNLALTCPTVAAEATYTAPTGDSVAWCWNYNSADPSQNGFGIVAYSGTGVTRTVNHALGSAPEFMVVKNRDNAAPNSQFCIYHASEGATKAAHLNASSAFFADSNMWANTEPTTSQFTVGTNQAVNNNGQDIVAYLWASVPGYSAFGSYTGNANANGPFVYLGFRPAFVLIKPTAAGNWHIYDSTREIYNPETKPLRPNLTNGESAVGSIDFLSNGFKLRTTTAINASATYVYACFAENPFQLPVTAR